MGWVRRLKAWAKAIRRDALTLWLAARDPRVPLAPKLLCAAVAAYALSPIDLIPDAIPLLGLLDEAILLPLAIRLAAALIPASLMAELRLRAAERGERPVSRAGAAAVVLLWAAGAALLGRWAWGWASG
jgi:uncharacterized membrane protein YkvA (DUF1232 family)